MKARKVKRMGDLIAVTGWMSPDEKKKLLAAIAKHPFINGQSDFINKAAEALITQSQDGPTIAQPLCFKTVDERAKLERYEAMQEMLAQPTPQARRRRKVNYSLNEPPAKYGASKKGKKS
jgi:tellurite resistance protein